MYDIFVLKSRMYTYEILVLGGRQGLEIIYISSGDMVKHYF